MDHTTTHIQAQTYTHSTRTHIPPPLADRELGHGVGVPRQALDVRRERELEAPVLPRVLDGLHRVRVRVRVRVSVRVRVRVRVTVRVRVMVRVRVRVRVRLGL